MTIIHNIEMSVLSHFKTAATLQTGFAVEQYLHRFGFHELGRRTNAAAFSLINDDKVIRISEDAVGSTEFFKMADQLKGNPYMPVVFGQATLPSGDHISCVELLETPVQKSIFPKYKELRQAVNNNEPLSSEDMQWFSEMDNCRITAEELSNTFMAPGYNLDIHSFPNPEAFKDASVAMLELTRRVNAHDTRFVPGPDMNPTNILFRRSAEGMQPVLYDPLIRQNYGSEAYEHTNEVRQKFGLTPATKITNGPS